MPRVKRKTDKEVIKEIEVAKDFNLDGEVVKNGLVGTSDELAILDTDNEEQKKLKTVFAGFRLQNPILWKRDKEIYLNQIKNNGGTK